MEPSIKKIAEAEMAEEKQRALVSTAKDIIRYRDSHAEEVEKAEEELKYIEEKQELPDRWKEMDREMPYDGYAKPRNF